MKTRILTAIIIFLCLGFAFRCALLETERETEVSYAYDIVFGLQKDRDHALLSDIPQATRILGSVQRRENLKQQPGSDLDDICNLQRANVIRDIIGHLRIETGEDLGPEPGPWMEKYGSKEFCLERANQMRVKGEFGKAIESYKVIEVEPDYAEGANGLAWIRATCPDEQYRDGEKALANATRAQEISGGTDWRITATLAAAYAESGDFEKAVDHQTKAIDLAPTNSDKEELHLRLELYKQGKPYREEPKKP